MSLRQRLADALQKLTADQRAQALTDFNTIDPEGTLDVESLANLIRDPSVPTERRATAVWVAGQIGEQTLAPLLESTVTSEESPRILWEAAKSLCSMGRGLEVFRRLLQSGGSPELRKVAAYALGSLGDSSAAADLCACLDNEDEDPAVRGQAAEALGYLRTESSFSSLEQAAEDASPEVRYWAVFALGQLGDQRAVPLLTRIAKEDRATVEGWGSVADEARAALDEV